MDPRMGKSLSEKKAGGCLVRLVDDILVRALWSVGFLRRGRRAGAVSC